MLGLVPWVRAGVFGVQDGAVAWVPAGGGERVESRQIANR